MKISTIIFVGFTFILFLFLLATAVNYQQYQEVKEDTEWLSNSHTIMRQLTTFQRNINEMENSLKGYILTGEPFFIQSYDSAAKENLEIFDILTPLITETSFQDAKLKEIKALHIKWQNEFAGPLLIARKNSDQSEQAQLKFQRLYRKTLRDKSEKELHDKIRSKFREFYNYEYNLRDKRKQILSASVVNTRWISIVLTSASILIGLIIAIYIARIISKRIINMVDLADSIAKGNFKVRVQDNSKDELSKLSHSLNSMAIILEENITELERKNNELDRFAYVVSHDLKAPLRGIENASIWIEEDYGDQLPEKVKEYLSMMKGRVKRMENLINGILELSRIGREKKSVEKVNVRLMLEEIVEMLSPGNGFTIKIAEKMPVFHTERIPLQQVFTNLLSNSIKYHHKAEGSITIECVEKDKFYQFSVSDDGPGIDPQFHEKIFIIFQTLKERDAFESTGVGLAIIKKILDDKKCTIQVVSEEGSGSNFIFTWPKHIKPE